MFGEVVDSEMKLNDLGEFSRNEIERIWDRDVVDVHEYVVMPNHVHLLLIKSEFTKDMNVWYERRDTLEACPDDGSERQRRDTLEACLDYEHDRFDSGWAASPSLHVQHDDYVWPRLWQIIGVFKWNVTKYAKKHDISFIRQSRYYDNRIRNEKSYEQVKHYIRSNPLKWNEDRYYDW